MKYGTYGNTAASERCETLFFIHFFRILGCYMTDIAALFATLHSSMWLVFGSLKVITLTDFQSEFNSFFIEAKFTHRWLSGRVLNPSSFFLETIGVSRWHFSFRGTCLEWCFTAESLFLFLTLRSTATLWSHWPMREPYPLRIHSLHAKTCSQSKHSHSGYQKGRVSQLVMVRYEV